MQECTCDDRTKELKAYFTNRTAVVWKYNRNILVTPETENEPKETAVGVCWIDSFGFRGRIHKECDNCWNAQVEGANKAMSSMFDD